MADDVAPDRAAATELLAGLHDIRMPEAAAGGAIAELAVLIAVALLAAAVVSLAAPAFTAARKAGAATLDDEIAAAARLGEDERALALLHLIRRRDPQAASGLRARLYGAGAFPTAEELEDRLRRAGAGDA